MTTIHHGEVEELIPAGPASLPRISEFGRAVLALRYAAAGWLVLPVQSVVNGGCTCGGSGCSSPGKHPKTPRGFKDATKDAEQIMQWFFARSCPNLGIRTGLESGLVVLDIDPAAGAG